MARPRFVFASVMAATCTAALAAGAVFGSAPAGAAVSYPSIPSSAALAPSPCAVSVTPFVANVPEGGNDTAGFAAAMASALATRSQCFAAGPSGKAQAVVYVPAGTYRLEDLYFPSNVRLEVSAAATLEPTRNRGEAASAEAHPMIMWDTTGKNKAPITNVSVVGVGENLDARKLAARTAGGPAMAGFDLSHDFTLNVDPAQTDSSNYSIGLSAVNVSYFRIQNVFSVQNNTGGPSAKITPWPTSSRAVLSLHGRRDSPVNGPFIQPMHGVISDHVNIGGPRGYGPNQINAGYDLKISDVYTQGGTALRLETDGSTNGRGVPKLGATVDQLTANNIVGVDCNRAVSLSPHGQRNGAVAVHNVWAYSCNQAVIASVDNDTYPQYRGSFRDPVVDGVRIVGGMSAQLDSTTYLWTVGQSLKPVQIDKGTWTPRISVVSQDGTFHRL